MSANLASVPQPGSVMTDEFTYESLDHASKEIRLVEIIRRTDQVFEVRLSKYEISGTPEYNAISYTWGNGETTRMTDIIVNGQKMQVTENCRYALEQAHSHYHLALPIRIYFWIDSICIDQNSDMEKQHQVAMMGRIYAQAVRVLACVGRHQDQSEDLARLLTTARSPSYSHEEQSESLAKATQDWFDATDSVTRALVEARLVDEDLMHRDVTISRCFNTLFDFSQRYYWSRLWIIQEVAVAKHLEILCGSDKFSRSDMYLLHWIAGCRLPWYAVHNFPALHDFYNTQSFSYFKFVLNRNLVDRIPALEILSSQSPFGWSRPEDRVYGMLSLMKWPEVNPPIHVEPIYTQSVNVDLAELFLSLPGCSLENIQGILKTLEICHDLNRVEELVAARSTPPTRHSDRSPYPVCLYDLQICACEVISKNEANQLTANFSRQEGHVNRSPGMLKMIRDAPKLLYARSEVAALLCEAASEGDFVIQTPFGQCLLVLRYTGESNQYHIVGQGLLIENFFFPRFWDGDLQINLSPRARHARQRFEDYLRYRAWRLLRDDPQPFENGLDLIGFFLYLESGRNERPRSYSPDGLSGRELSKPGLDVVFGNCIREFTRNLKDLENATDELQSRASDVLMCFTLELQPLEMLLLGCQDLEKDGSRNEGKAMQRLNTTVCGRALSREKSHDLDLADFQFLGVDMPLRRLLETFN